MMVPDKKKLASVIVEKISPPSMSQSESSPEEVKEDNSVGLELASQKMMAALKADDVKGFAAGLQEFLDIHEMKESE